jgi:hypothetical protein
VSEDREAQTDWSRRKKRFYREAVMETLETLGFDVADVNEIQQDILFLRRLRKASDAAGARTVTAIVGLVFTAVGALLVIGFQTFLKR